jgi:hypothetical protein
VVLLAAYIVGDKHCAVVVHRNSDGAPQRLVIGIEESG